MIHFERQVIDPVLINEMLKLFDHVNVGMNDQDGVPYVVPTNFGYEMDDTTLRVYLHMMKHGKKVTLLQQDARVCLTWSLFNDFPYHPYKGHRHDYRSVIAKGILHFYDGNDDYEIFKKGYDLLYTCNQREIVPLESRKSIPNMYICEVVCSLKDVTAKSEFPLRTIEDVPMLDVYSAEEDHTPFDLTDIIEKNKHLKG